MQQDHFKYIFWYIVGTTIFVFAYNILILFVTIPDKNIRFADTAQGFLLGTVLASGAAYLWGGSPVGIKPMPKPGTTNVELTATTNDVKNNEDVSPADTSKIIVEGFKKTT